MLRHAGAIDAATKVSSFEASPIGTGQVGADVRYALSYDPTGTQGPATVVGKFSSRDEASYRKDAPALREVLKTFAYLEPKTETSAH